MCYILGANLNGRFLLSPLPMTSAHTPAQPLLTELVTQPKRREPNVGTEREIGQRQSGEGGGAVDAMSLAF